MKSENRSQAFLRKRKMMLVLPLLVFPFLTMAFWALGGGSVGQVAKSGTAQGLNLDLPSSNIKDDKADNKLSFYDRAQRDSAKLEEWMRNDPYYRSQRDTPQQGGTKDLEQITNQTASKFNQHLNTTPYESSGSNAEQKLMEKLAVLQQELAKPSAKENRPPSIEATGTDAQDITEQTNRLQNLMEDMQTSDSEDPEMKQIGTTLDKILDIQHPERVKSRLKQTSAEQKIEVYPVSKNSGEKNSSLLGFQNRMNDKGFFSLNNDKTDTAEENTMEAEVFTSQTIVNGSVVKFRLLTPVYINGRVVPKGTYANGLASLNNERLEVEINSIRTGHVLLPVKLTVYDLDGLPGLYVPGAISRDVAKQSVDNSLELLELPTMDPSLKAQLATTGINAAKSLLSRKAKQVKVFIKAGYKVLLKNAA